MPYETRRYYCNSIWPKSGTARLTYWEFLKSKFLKYSSGILGGDSKAKIDTISTYDVLVFTAQRTPQKRSRALSLRVTRKRNIGACEEYTTLCAGELAD